MKHITTIIAIILMIGCAKTTTSNTEYEVKTTSEADSKEFVSECTGYVELETTDKSLVGEILKIKITDEDIFLHCYYNGSILRFDRKTGKFKNSIGHKGRGPEEYVNLTDFDTYDGNTYIYSNVTKKLYVHSNDGKFIKTIDVPNIICWNISIDDKGNVCFASEGVNSRVNSKGEAIKQNDYDYYIFDIDSGEYIAKYDELEEGENATPRMQGSAFIGHSNNNLYVAKAFDHTIYKMSQKGYEPYIKVKPEYNGAKTVDEVRRDPTFVYSIQEYTKSFDQFWYHMGFEESQRYIMAGFQASFDEWEGSTAMCLAKIDKQTGESKYIRLNKGKDENFPYLRDIHGRIGWLQNGMLISVVKPYRLRDDERFKHLKYDANPVLFFHKLNME